MFIYVVFQHQQQRFLYKQNLLTSVILYIHCVCHEKVTISFLLTKTYALDHYFVSVLCNLPVTTAK